MNHLKSAGPFVAMAGLLLILFYKVLFLGYVLVAADVLALNLPWAAGKPEPTIQNWYVADSVYQFYPWQLYFEEMLSRGEAPLWNPYSFAGHPILANSQSGFFDPFNLLFALFDFTTAHDLVLVLQLYAAGVFTYLYLRRSIGLERFGALIGGTVYMLNGVFTVWLEWLWMVGGALWLPLVLLLLDKAWKEARRGYAILAGIPLGFSFLAGMVQQWAIMLLALWLYTFIKSFFRRHGAAPWRVLLDSLPAVGVASAVGLAVAAVQILPTLELVLQSQRGPDPSSNLVAWFEAFPKNAILSLLFLVDFIHPYWTGNPQSLDFRTLVVWPTFGANIVEFQGYVGIGALVLSAIAVLAVRSEATRVFLTLALAMLVLSLLTPANLWIYFRGLFVYTFSMAVLAGVGAHHLASAEGSKALLLRVDAVLIRALGGMVLLVALGNVVLQLWRDELLAFGRGYLEAHSLGNYLQYTGDREYVLGKVDALLENYLITAPAMYVPVLTVAAIIALFATYRRGILSRPLFLHAWFAICGAELVYFGMSFTPMAEERELYPPTQLTEFLKRDRELYRVLPLWRAGMDTPILYPNTHMAYQIQSVRGNDALFPQRYREFLGLLEAWQGEDGTSRASNLVDMMNVKYILVGPQRELDGPRLRKVFDEDVRVYQNEGVLPRAFVVHEATVLRDKAEIFARLLSADFDPRREVVLEEPSGFAPVAAEQDGRSSAQVLSHSAHRMLVRSELEREGFLVVGDAFYPGWKAYVDGQEAPIYRANYVLRAVHLDAGKHEVRFVYDPWWFEAGLWISGAALLLAGGSLLHAQGSRCVPRPTPLAPTRSSHGTRSKIPTHSSRG